MIGLRNVAGECTEGGGYVRMLDDFKMGPNLVRGFQPGGHRPARYYVSDDERRYRRHDVLGRQPRIPVSVLLPAQGQRLPRRHLHRFRIGVGLQGRDAECRRPEKSTALVNCRYAGATGFTCQCGMQYADDASVRMSAGASFIWDSPFGPLRFDFAYPILKQWYDRTQFFAFGGGTQF